MKRVIAVVEAQGHPEGVFLGDSVLHLADQVYLWMRKVREQGLLPEVHYWAILESGECFEDHP